MPYFIPFLGGSAAPTSLGCGDTNTLGLYQLLYTLISHVRSTLVCLALLLLYTALYFTLTSFSLYAIRRRTQFRANKWTVRLYIIAEKSRVETNSQYGFKLRYSFGLRTGTSQASVRSLPCDLSSQSVAGASSDRRRSVRPVPLSNVG